MIICPLAWTFDQGSFKSNTTGSDGNNLVRLPAVVLVADIPLIADLIHDLLLAFWILEHAEVELRPLFRRTLPRETVNISQVEVLPIVNSCAPLLLGSDGVVEIEVDVAAVGVTPWLVEIEIPLAFFVVILVYGDQDSSLEGLLERTFLYAMTGWLASAARRDTKAKRIFIENNELLDNESILIATDVDELFVVSPRYGYN